MNSTVFRPVIISLARVMKGWPWFYASRPAMIMIAILSTSYTLAQPPASKRRAHVEVATDLGRFTLELYNETPVHRDHFIQMVKEGRYDSLLFHRVVPGFVIEGGAAGKECQEEELLPAEVMPGVIHERGALAAAHASDVPDPLNRSHCLNFYIVQGRRFSAADLDLVEERNAGFGTPHTFTPAEKAVYSNKGGAPHLDGNYTVFGHVVEGMEVIDAIAALPVDRNDSPARKVHMFMRLK